MAYLAIRRRGAVNDVSRLHEKVSWRVFEALFPHWPADEVPVGYVTNGVHMPTWDSAAVDDLWTQACGQHRWLGTTETLEQPSTRRKHPDVRPNRGRFGDTKHSPHGLQLDMRETRFVRMT